MSAATNGQLPKRDRLLQRLDNGETVLGVLVVSPSPELVEILAYVGFDYIMVDQMFTAVDWSDMAHMVRAAEAYDMCVIGRVENDPWYGSGDHGVSARVARAIGVGCDGVKINVADAEQARRALEAAAGWHRKLHIVPFEQKDFAAYESSGANAGLIIPGVESEKSIAEVDQILALDGLRVFSIAMTDTSRMLGYPGEYEHPEVWKFVDRVVADAAGRGIDICAGTGYAYRTPDAIAGRVSRMVEHGIRMVFIQTAEFLLQMATSQLLERVRDELGAAKEAARA